MRRVDVHVRLRLVHAAQRGRIRVVAVAHLILRNGIVLRGGRFQGETAVSTSHKVNRRRCSDLADGRCGAGR